MSKSRFVTGLRAVEQLLATRPADVSRVYTEYQTANPRVEAIASAASGHGIEVQFANRARLAQLCGEHRHQGVVAEIRRSTLLDEAGLRTLVERRLEDDGDRALLLLVLERVQDPHNLGAAMRSADAAAVDALVVPRHGSAGMSPAVSKVAAGAAEHLPLARVPNLGRVLDWLRAYDVSIIGTSDAADADLFETDLTGPLALVMGGEHGGLSSGIAARCATTVCLPMLGVVSSLNVSVAAGICLYETLRQRRRIGI